MITDSHAHIYYPEILEQLPDILSRAKDAGVNRIIAPAVDLETSRSILKLTEKHDMLFCALGVHPCDVNKNELTVIDEIEKLIEHEKVIAIGETGLDYYWDVSGIEKQKSFFQLQIELAKAYKLPIIIHTRNSVDDSIEMIKKNYDENLRGQFHCFSGNLSQLDQVVSLKNFFVSYCGNVTYKNFTDTEVVLKTPLDRLLSETDSPFLPPVPFRGKKNEPSYIAHTLKKISDIKNIAQKELEVNILENVSTLFFNKS